jgi:hypothetical protein
MNYKRLSVNWLFVVSILWFFLNFEACHKSPKCWGKTISNSGLIAFDTTVCENCTMTANEEQQFVITNQSAYNKLIYYSYGNNGVCALNPIDFSRYSLLGLNTFVSCNYKIVRNVVIDEAKKKYVYTIEINECGKCSEQSYIQHWVLIPKIKAGYAVEFVLTRY